MTKPTEGKQPTAAGPKERYAALLEDGALKADPVQASVIEKLQGLHDHLLARSAVKADEGLLARLGLKNWSALASGRRQTDQTTPGQRGLYIHGPVGRGKSMLMDLFFETAPLEPKRRVHFHAFMQDVHKSLNALRQRAEDQAPDGVISTLAADIVDNTRLLCFDEFHVQNIADAMILGRLFDHLFDAGTVVVATSNFPPDRLYENGLNRDRFLPFIERLKSHLEIVTLAGPTDYRLGRLLNTPVYYSPAGPETHQALAVIFAELTDGASGEVEEIEINSRRLVIPKAARGVAWFGFADLCEQPLWASDYLALAERYHTIILEDVPKLTGDKHNEARRFMTLVDALYECRVNLILSADAEPHELYQAGEGAFEFERTASRLMEMRSRDYIQTPPSTIAAADFVPFALTTDLV
ncbi:MAG: cell division protein ZapE [Geminicoccaceae bacterium]